MREREEPPSIGVRLLYDIKRNKTLPADRALPMRELRQAFARANSDLEGVAHLEPGPVRGWSASPSTPKVELSSGRMPFNRVQPTLALTRRPMRHLYEEARRDFDRLLSVRPRLGRLAVLSIGETPGPETALRLQHALVDLVSLEADEDIIDGDMDCPDDTCLRSGQFESLERLVHRPREGTAIHLERAGLLPPDYELRRTALAQPLCDACHRLFRVAAAARGTTSV